MSDLRELYQEMILDHHKTPRNYGAMADASHKAEGFNPLCGDKVTIYLLIKDGRIESIQFEGSGCAICMASTSVMTDSLAGKSVDEVERLFGKFHDLVTSSIDTPADVDDLGKLVIFAGVREYPVRVKCATLGWHTVQAALKGGQNLVSTE